MMVFTCVIAAALLQSGLGTSLDQRIGAAVKLLGSSHEAVQDQLGRPSAVTEGNGVWVYGSWVPSPRLGFVVSYFRDNDGEPDIFKTAQYVSGSVGAITTKTLTVAGGRKVPRDFCWISGESTASVLSKLGAAEVKYYAQKTNPNIVLTLCKVSDTPVFVYSRQIDGDQIVPSIGASGNVDFRPSLLDAYAFSVGQCSEWHYTAGFTQQEITGPGSYADRSLATDPWTELR